MNEPVCPACRRTFINCSCEGPDWGFSFDASDLPDEDAGPPPLEFDTIDPNQLGPLEFAGIAKQRARGKRRRRAHSRP